MKRCIPFVLAAVLLSGASAQARFNPSLSWTTLTTPHFLVHFHQGEEELAARSAALAEEIHDRLVPRVGWSPAARTHMVLVDDTDYASGFATVFPSNRIVLHPAPPSGETGFGAVPCDDWLRLLITHEYTHVLQLDMVERLPRVLRRILGRIYFPNEFQPLWLIEGLATYEETELTSGGRGRAPLTDMVLRMAALEGPFPPLDRAAVVPDAWPAGDTPYLFGESFLRFLAERYGRDKLAELSRVYSGRWVPFLVNSTARRVLRKYYGSLWREWAGQLRDRAARQVAAVEAVGRSPSQPLTRRGFLNVLPSFSPDGTRIAYYSMDADRFPGLYLMNADGSDDRKLADNLAFPGSGPAGLAWDPSGRGLYFTRLEVRRNTDHRYDLWYYDLARHKAVRITDGLRVGDPSPSPDGSKLLCTVTGLGGSRLALLDLRANSSAPLGPEDLVYLTEEGEARYSAPRWSPDGTRIAVNVWQPGGYRDIWILDDGGRKIAAASRDRAQEGAPSWSPDGRLVFFSSDRTGIFNLYAWEPDSGRLLQVSNVIGGAFCPAPSPDGRRIAFASYGPKGYDLGLLSLDPASWHPAPEYRDPYPEPATGERTKPFPTTRSTYQPWSTLAPRFWLPWYGYSAASGFMPGFYTLGQDVLERHSWSATVLYGPASGRWNYFLDYAWDGLDPILRIALRDRDVTHTGLLEEGDRRKDYAEAERSLDIRAVMPLLGIESQHQFSLGYRRLVLDALTDLSRENWYSGPPPAEGPLAGIQLVWNFNSARRYANSVSPEDGRTFQLSYERFEEALGGDFTLDRYSADWQEYLGLPWRHQVLKVRGFFGASEGDILPQRAFQLGGDPPGDLSPAPDQPEVTLRGYPVNSMRGEKAALLSLEHRFPVLEIQRGAGTTPFYLRRLHGALFVEGGEAWDRSFDLSEVRTGIGIEARLDLIFAYWFPVTLRAVAARGLNRDGVSQLYLAIWVPL